MEDLSVEKEGKIHIWIEHIKNICHHQDQVKSKIKKEENYGLVDHLSKSFRNMNDSILKLFTIAMIFYFQPFIKCSQQFSKHYNIYFFLPEYQIFYFDKLMGNPLSCCYHREQLLNFQRLQALDESILQQVQQLRFKHRQQLNNAQVYYFGKITFVGKVNGMNKKVGYGQLYHEDNVLLGVFQNDLPNGYGIVIKNYEQYFKGEFRNGLYHGKGRQYHQKQQYQGEYMNEFRKKGILTTDQLKYDGQFKNNVFQGEGQLTLKSGVTYQGHFVNGKYQGQGSITYPNQNRYQGQFFQGNYNGKGKFQWADGVKAVGQYKNGKRLDGAKFQYFKESKIDSNRTIEQQIQLSDDRKVSLFQVDETKFNNVSKIVRGNGILQLL